MLTCVGAALAATGPTAALTATVLIASAAVMATSVRENCDRTDISLSPFLGPVEKRGGSCRVIIKERANPAKLRKT